MMRAYRFGGAVWVELFRQEQDRFRFERYARINYETENGKISVLDIASFSVTSAQAEIIRNNGTLICTLDYADQARDMA